MLKKTFAIALLLLIGTPIGCSSKGAGTTPRETLENMQQAMLDGDDEKFASCFDANPEQKKALMSLCNFSHAMFEMQEALIDEYGSSGSQGSFKSQMDKMRSDWLDKLKIEIIENKAYADQKGNLQSISLVRKAGLWLIAVGSMQIPAQSAELGKKTKMFDTMAEISEKIINKIGSKDYSAKKAGQEFTAVMMKELMTIVPTGKGQPFPQRAARPQRPGKGTMTITPAAKKKK